MNLPISHGMNFCGSLPFHRHTRDSLCSITLFQRKSIVPTIHSILIAIGRFTRRLIGCGISGCHFDQTVVCSLFDDALVVGASKSLSPTHNLSLSHHRWRRKLLSAGRRQTLAVLPRSRSDVSEQDDATIMTTTQTEAPLTWRQNTRH